MELSPRTNAFLTGEGHAEPRIPVDTTGTSRAFPGGMGRDILMDVLSIQSGKGVAFVTTDCSKYQEWQ